MELKFSFAFNNKFDMGKTCEGNGIEDADIYSTHGREIERTVRRVMVFLEDFVGINDVVIGLTHGFRGISHTVQIVQREDVADALVGWFTTIYFSVAYEYGRMSDVWKAGHRPFGEVVVVGGNYGDAHIQIYQPEEDGGMRKCQSLDIVPVGPSNDAQSGKSLREKFAGKFKPASIVSSAF